MLCGQPDYGPMILKFRECLTAERSDGGEVALRTGLGTRLRDEEASRRSSSRATDEPVTQSIDA